MSISIIRIFVFYKEFIITGEWMNNRYLITNNTRKFILYQRDLDNINKYRPQFSSKNKAIEAAKLMYIKENNNETKKHKTNCIYIIMYNYNGEYKKNYKLNCITYKDNNKRWVLF